MIIEVHTDGIQVKMQSNRMEIKNGRLDQQDQNCEEKPA